MTALQVYVQNQVLITNTLNVRLPPENLLGGVSNRTISITGTCNLSSVSSNNRRHALTYTEHKGH